ncbi:MAG: hypothetical protein FWG40_00890 [Peptococcaceae bacterium]|nr:hypothetical protein [Peptococcaceae bacterium]
MMNVLDRLRDLNDTFRKALDGGQQSYFDGIHEGLCLGLEIAIKVLTLEEGSGEKKGAGTDD